MKINIFLRCFFNIVSYFKPKYPEKSVRILYRISDLNLKLSKLHRTFFIHPVWIVSSSSQSYANPNPLWFWSIFSFCNPLIARFCRFLLPLFRKWTSLKFIEIYLPLLISSWSITKCFTCPSMQQNNFVRKWSLWSHWKTPPGSR